MTELEVALTAELERVNRQCAEMRNAIISAIAGQKSCAFRAQFSRALSSDAGSDYVHRDQVKDFTCFQCGDGNTPLYCLNCAEGVLKNKSVKQL